MTQGTLRIIQPQISIRGQNQISVRNATLVSITQTGGGAGAGLASVPAAQGASVNDLNLDLTGLPAVGATPVVYLFDAPATNTGAMRVSTNGGTSYMALASPTGGALKAGNIIAGVPYAIRLSAAGAKVVFSGAQF